ncbi:MAG: hypothetical protein IT290_12855 [Deltaproteobacteria bacterium]|nr:hypothetical protein [Deltaproteobacteria bacterium]
MASYTKVLQRLGLAPNEAKIYELLLEKSECSTAQISEYTGIHRRNIYDSLTRLTEKGLVFEILQSRENRYQAVDPNKLSELVQEKQALLARILPDLSALQNAPTPEQEVLLYRGLDGWRMYMHDILRIGADFYSVGSRGIWLDKRAQHFFPRFIREIQRKRLRHLHLFDSSLRERTHPIFEHVGTDFRLLPDDIALPCSVDIFGPRVCIVSSRAEEASNEDLSFTVIENAHLAEAFRTWFRFLWEHLPPTAEARHYA